MALMASMSATWPYRLTGMMALVRGVIAASISAASMLQVSGSTSTNTGVAPSSTIISAGGGEGEGRGDDLVAAADAQRHHRDQQRLGAAGHADAVARADEGGELVLQLLDLGAHDVLAVVEHALHARVDALAQRRVLRLQVGEGQRRQ